MNKTRRTGEDITGKRFGRLLALSYKSNPGRAMWICRCDCGKSTMATAVNLRSGNTKSCGCLKADRLARGRAEMIGRRFGRLVVMSESGRIGRGVAWACSCDCGAMTTATTGQLMAGERIARNGKRSCGCLTFKHRGTGSREYSIWKAMKNRCLNPNASGFERYGGRGISICQEWVDSFESFIEAMGPCPPGMSIDRIDNAAGYAPENCRWATDSEQMANRAVTILLTARGETRTIPQWSGVSCVSEKTLRARYYSGWDHERAIFTPSRNKNGRRRSV